MQVDHLSHRHAWHHGATLAAATALLTLAPLPNLAWADLILEYNGNPLDESLVTGRSPEVPLSPGVSRISIRVELPIAALPPNTKFAFNSEHGTGYDWTPISTNVWQRVKTAKLEVSDGVRTVSSSDRVSRIQLGITTGESGEIVGWGMSAFSLAGPPPANWRMSSSNRDANSKCPTKFMDWTAQDGQLVTGPNGSRDQSFASKTCQLGTWIVKIRG